MMNLKTRRSRAVIAFAAVLTLAASVAEARPGGRGSFGSRGSRTFDAPAATQTAPNAARPIERSQTQPGQFQQRPAPAPQAPVQRPAGSRFGTGFFAGLLGAGLLGALFGSGFFGGLGGIAAFLGLLLQVALFGGLIWLALSFFRRRQQPAYAGSTPRPLARSALGGNPTGSGLGAGLGGMAAAGGAAAAAGAARRPGGDEVGIGPADYEGFERALTEIQTAYGREDVAGLWQAATPEMASYFQEELNDNARQGVVNRIGAVKLLQGDLAEAWREGETDYATVAMRYELTDATVDRATGRVVSGDLQTPTQATEIWTFRRDRGGPWKLSAIQQAA